MKNINKNILFLFALASIVFTGCEQSYTLGELTTPSSLEVNYTITGATAEAPWGDGTGEVVFTATAENAITLTFDFGDGKDMEIAGGGVVTHTFSKTGIVIYNVTVTAVGTGGLTASKTLPVEVFSSFTDDDALEYLTDGASKTWYWASDQGGHVGLGPNFVDGSNHTFAAWYNAAANEKPCMYDAEFVFTKTETGELTFEMLNGPAHIPGTYAGKIGVGADACYGEDVVPTMFGVKSVSFGPAETIATSDGGYRGTAMTISDGGFMGWYVGKSEYEIISINENTLKVRIAEDETFAWYQTLVSTKPAK